MKTHSHLSLLPILDELRQRIEAIEEKLEKNNPTRKDLNDTSGSGLDMTEIQDYLEKMHMA